MRFIAIVVFILGFYSKSYASGASLSISDSDIAVGAVVVSQQIISATNLTMALISGNRLVNNREIRIAPKFNFALGSLGAVLGASGIAGIAISSADRPVLLGTSILAIATGATNLIVGGFVLRHEQNRATTKISAFVHPGRISAVGITVSFR